MISPRDAALDIETTGLDPMKHNVVTVAIVGQIPCGHYMDFGGVEHEFDLVTRKFTILDLDKEKRKLYCVSDAQLVMALYQGLDGGGDVAVGQAVLLDEGLSIL